MLLRIAFVFSPCLAIIYFSGLHVSRILVGLHIVYVVVHVSDITAILTLDGEFFYAR